jgi:hypothetical protein
MPSEVTLEHLQDLMSHGFMTTVELVTCHVPADPTSPVPVGGGVRGGLRDVLRARVWCAITSIPLLFAVVLWPRTAPPDPSRTLHIAAFVTLCEAYMGIEPHFFCAQLSMGSGAEAAVLDSVDICVRSGHGVDPYFHLPMSRSTNGW